MRKRKKNMTLKDSEIGHRSNKLKIRKSMYCIAHLCYASWEYIICILYMCYIFWEYIISELVMVKNMYVIHSRRTYLKKLKCIPQNLGCSKKNLVPLQIIHTN